MFHMASTRANRIGLVVNYLGLLSSALVFCIGEYHTWDPLLVVVGLICLAVTAATFIRLYVRTGLLKLIHSTADVLDEREMALVHNALRSSYRVFTAVSMALVAFMVVSVRFSFFTLTHRGHYSFGILALVFLNYLIHILPASVIALKEKAV